MTSGEAFWNLVEAQVRCTIPTYVKNLLRLRGYDNALSVKTLTDEDLKSLETFARTKMWMYIPPDANDKDYYHMFSIEPESFEILPGHVKMLKEIAKQVDVINQDHQDSATSFHTISRTSSELNNSSQGDENQLRSSKEERGSSIVPCKDQRNDLPQATAAVTIKQQEPFKAFIVNGSPEQFYIQLESAQSELDRIEALLKSAPTWPVFNKKLVGQMCAALYDGSYYRGIILSSDDRGATVHYIDYGNKAISTDLRKLPENVQRLKRLAILCRLESKHGTFSPQLVERFENLSRDDAYEMKFVSEESNPAIVQLFVDAVLFAESKKATKFVSVPALNDFDKQFDDIEETNRKLEEILNEMSELVAKSLLSTHQDETPSMPHEMPKFVEPTSLKDGDFVVIRYVESPTLFSVQLTTSIAEYDAMMDRLCDYCATASAILRPQVGMACAASYKNDSEWYRAEILNIGRNDALTRFVDYGIELTIEINKLKEIGNEFLLMPKQAIPCCILGFESLKAVRAIKDLFEFLAEYSNGGRRKFQARTFGTVNGTTLVNLVDVKAVPVLDLSMRLMELGLPRVRSREQQTLKKSKSTAQSIEAISDCGGSLDSQISPLAHDLGSSMQCRYVNTTHPDNLGSSSMNSRLQRIFNGHLSHQFLSLISLVQIDNIRRMLLLWESREFSNHLIKYQGEYSVQSPFSSPAVRAPKLKSDSAQMQMIRNHLGVQQSTVPQNKTEFLPLSMTHYLNNVDKAETSPAVIPKEQLVDYMPTFESGTLLVNGTQDMVDETPKFIEPAKRPQSLFR
ncbi:hypothetical protein HA402_016001 [Bradysia odoriphaga]|nr:hypothetical protein HA402_016001 [Bradysia odoriphaga]